MSERHPTGEQLNAYLLDELGPPERRELRAHLDACAACRAATEALAVPLAAYRAGAPAPADEMALGRLLARAATRSAARPRWIAVAAAAAAAVMIFLGGFWAGRSDASRAVSAPAQGGSPVAVRARFDREPPPLTFAAADADLLGGLAPRDTTWN